MAHIWKISHQDVSNFWMNYFCYNFLYSNEIIKMHFNFCNEKYFVAGNRELDQQASSLAATYDLLQDWSNSRMLPVEILLSCTKPSMLSIGVDRTLYIMYCYWNKVQYKDNYVWLFKTNPSINEFILICVFNLLRPDDTHMWPGSSLVQVMNWWLFCATPLPKPILTCDQFLP